MHLQHDMHVCCALYARPILGLRPDDVTFSAAKLFFAALDDRASAVGQRLV